MTILKPAFDFTITQWPKSPEEWAAKPEIEFTVPLDTIVQPGDRLFMQEKMIKKGPRAGAIVKVFYIIMRITKQSIHSDNMNEIIINAVAQRVEE